MIIGSKLPPERVEMTFFNSGRAAFAFLLDRVVRPKKIYLPSYTCWSLVSAMGRRFPGIEVEYYPVGRDLTCKYPEFVGRDEALVFIHYFGHENSTPLPESGGTILEDVSHSHFSSIGRRGDFVFGSYRKVLRVGDGGFIEGYFNPVYEESRKLDTWLRYEAVDWRDVREAENMIDRDWQIADISGQSLAVVLKADREAILRRRRENERFLAENVSEGRPLLTFREGECPLVHNRLMPGQDERDSLRRYLAGKGIYTSIHWPTHRDVLESGTDIDDTLWLESHIISIPVSHDYGPEHMQYVAECIERWRMEGAE
jgi:dTDP-4-amino-4,6-dideoxygalactose transaminase